MTQGNRQQDYLRLASEITTLAMRRNNNSWRLASHLLARSERQAVQSIYGFVYLAGELVASLDNKQLLQEFKQETYKAIKRQLSFNPILQAFAATALRYKIDVAMIEAFFSSKEAELTKTRYAQAEFDRYIYGSGEVIGLMCLKVFAADNRLLYQDSAPAAQSLGAAFQKLNILRNFGRDYREQKRLSIPNMGSIKQFSVAKKTEMEAAISNDLTNSRSAIDALPLTAKIAVAAAFCYNEALLNEIRGLTPAQLYSRRIHLPAYRKAWLVAQAIILQGLLGRKL